MTKLYCYNHKPVTENVESDLDSDEFHTEIKENVDGAIPESVSKLNKIVSYDDTDSDSQKFVVYAFLFVPRLNSVSILYFLSAYNYL